MRVNTRLVQKRMDKFQEEISHWNEYNYVVINDNLEKCYKNIRFNGFRKKRFTQKQDLKN